MPPLVLFTANHSNADFFGFFKRVDPANRAPTSSHPSMFLHRDSPEDIPVRDVQIELPPAREIPRTLELIVPKSCESASWNLSSL